MLMTHAVVQLCGGWCCQCYVWSGRIHLCLFGNDSRHVWYAAVSVWSFVLTESKASCMHKPLVQPPFNTQQPDWVFFRYKARWKSGTVLNEVKLWERAVHKRQNEHVHNSVLQAEMRTFSSRSPQNMNEFMNVRSLNAFMHNTVDSTICSFGEEILIRTERSSLMDFKLIF